MLPFEDALREVFEASGDRIQAALKNDESMLPDYDHPHFRDIANDSIRIITSQHANGAPLVELLTTTFASAFHAGRKVGHAENKLDFASLGITESSISDARRR